MRIETHVILNGKQIDLTPTNSNNLVFDHLIPEDGYYSFTFTLKTDLTSPSVFIPAIWYRGNDKGEGCFPSSKANASWAFYEHRMPISGLLCLSGKEGTIITTIDKAERDDEIATVSWCEDNIIYTIAGEETPYSHRGKTSLVKDEEKKGVYLKKGEHYTRKLSLFETPKTDPLSAYEEFLRQREVAQRTPLFSWHEYEIAKLVHILTLIRKAEDGNAYLIMGMGNGELQEVYNFTAASFLVKSLEAAWALLKTDETLFDRDDIHLKRARARLAKEFDIADDYQMLPTLAQKISAFFLKGEKRPGLFQDNHNLATGECGGYLGIGEHPEFKFMVNTRCNGEALSSYLKIYKYTKDEKILNLCKRVATFYINSQLEDGNFGRWWDLDGICCDKNGTNGAHVGSFLIELRDEWQDKALDTAVLRALNYYTKLALDGEFYGDTLDADSSDKEAGVSLLNLFLTAIEHGIGDREKLLSAAKYSASFIITYIFQEELYLPKDSPLKKAGFFFEGVTSVSVAHNHLDFYGLLIAKDFLRLYKITGDSFYKEEALLMANACRQLIGMDENDYLGRSEDFFGWQPEQINYTSWEYFSRRDMMNGHFDIDIAWLNVLGYSAYLEIKDILNGD